ncbi:MAG: hypothetical protein IJ174_06810 [Clostridia bacterium]|nr:hypothetical protein [Clostridia bacterium]
MKSDVILIDSNGDGFQRATEETWKVAGYVGLSRKESLRLQLCTEEMLCLLRSVTGEAQASFWIECDKNRCELHLTTKTEMNKEKRSMLLFTATSRKNEAAGTFLGKVRDAFEVAMMREADPIDQIPEDILPDLPNHVINSLEWDGYERSVLKNVSDEVKVGIRGRMVDLTVCRNFA